jgi:alkylated DNA repair dioxygenase AlkB
LLVGTKSSHPLEERALVERFEELPFKPFEFYGFLAKRRIVSFGWHYDFPGRTLRDSDPIPAFLLPLLQRAADIAGVPADGLQQILINEYAPGAGIGWHRDRPMFEEVVGVSFGATPSGCFAFRVWEVRCSSTAYRR